MTCASPAAPLETSRGSSLLHALLTLWQRQVSTERMQHRLAAPDDRALRDLGLLRDDAAPPRPSDAADIWLNRVPG